MRGEIITGDGFEIFFGDESLNSVNIQKNFPSSYYINQVHGHRIVSASSKLKSADGHYTESVNKPLIIKTADCLPVFFSHGKRVVALHIGWRGLKQKILSHYVKKSVTPFVPATLYIGPHIQQSSFEIDYINAKSILQPHNITWSNALKNNIALPSDKRSKHVRLDLSRILALEAEKLGFKKIITSSVDTYWSHCHYSYRRHPFQQKRNYSFIVKL